MIPCGHKRRTDDYSEPTACPHPAAFEVGHSADSRLRPEERVPLPVCRHHVRLWRNVPGRTVRRLPPEETAANPTPATTPKENPMDPAAVKALLKETLEKSLGIAVRSHATESGSIDEVVLTLDGEPFASAYLPDRPGRA